MEAGGAVALPIARNVPGVSAHAVMILKPKRVLLEIPSDCCPAGKWRLKINKDEKEVFQMMLRFMIPRVAHCCKGANPGPG